MSQRILASIQKTAQRGADIIKQVLSFARGVEVEKTPIKPASLVKDIAQIVSGTFPKSLIIKTTIEKNLPDILGDPTQLQQVLLNLCVNARDAMTNSGVVTITVSFIIVNESFRKRNIEATADQYVVLSVSDTGSGIPENILGRIFDPFFTTKEIGKGTGLGLSTVHAIVKGHHGFITVDSELEKGTTFYVHLPAAPVTVSREAVTVKKEP
jgi:signal transduction histidine kinase